MFDSPSAEFQERNIPFSAEAEEAVLGAILLNPEVWVDIASFLQQDDFFLLRHRWIWEAMQRITERNESLDYLTVSEELAQLGHLEDIDGTASLVRLINNTPVSVHAEVYGRIVERAALRRRLLAAAETIQGVARDEKQNTDDVIKQTEESIFSAIESREKRELVPISSIIEDYYRRIEYLIRHSDAPLGLPTGFRAIEQLLGGMQKSDLLIFAGRPGMGKTSFLLSVLLFVARQGGRVAFFTMEMDREQIVQRLASMETGITMQKLRLGQLSTNEQGRLVEAMDRLGELQIFVDDTPALNPLELRAKCRRMNFRTGVDLIIVDYMQLMNAGGAYENNRVQEISFISRSMKELARDLNIPLLSAAQLSRAVEQRQDKRPQLRDLRESGSIEQDADIVMFLYRDEVYNEATEIPGQADIIVAKHRNGPTGTVSLFFDKAVTRFRDVNARPIDLGAG
ncbi:MAG: replicative DNA helicase [Anaerolineaceae bacterium]|nr:replicative DNA helicase [Anaerolineaceae bacterium]MDE0328435.1 replicative DNA helicase [Anaerolineaceae bacterium]